MSLLGPLCAFLASCTWAVGVSAYAVLARGYAASSINATRAAVAVPVFAAVVIVTSGGVDGALEAVRSLGGSRLRWLGFSILCSYAVADAAFLRSATSLGVPASLAIASTYPVWAAVAGAVLRHEPLGWARRIGLVAVVVGTIVVIVTSRDARRDDGAAVARPRLAVGVALALATSLLWALNSFSVAEGGRGAAPALVSLVRMSYALALCPLFGLFVPRLIGAPSVASPLVLPWAALRRTGWVFLLEGIGGTLFFIYGLTHTPLAVGAALSSLAPVIAVPIALVTRAEPFSPTRGGAILLVVVGIVLLVG